MLTLIMSACTSHKPIYTSASYSTLPPSGSRVSVVGNNLAILPTVETWLQDRGLYVVAQNATQANAMPLTGAPCLDRCEPAATLEAAKAAGTDYAILV